MAQFTRHGVCQMKHELTHLAILEPVVGTSGDPRRQCVLQINGSPYSYSALHHRFNWRPTDTIPMKILMRQLL